jgi:inner membrane protein
MAPTGRARALLHRPSAPTVCIAGIGLAGADWAYQRAGDSAWPGGPLDETAHLLTALLVLWALGRRATERVGLAALIASVAIDLDHVPDRLGAGWITAGTPRPYTHSLLTVALILSAALVRRRRAELLIGLALGTAIHLWRDLAETGSGVSLLWPFSYQSFSLPHATYVAAIVAVAIVASLRPSGAERTASRSRAAACR